MRQTASRISRMKTIVSLSVPVIFALTAMAQQPRFEAADVHISTTPRWFAQNNGGRLQGRRYVNRDATLLQLIEAAYDVKEDGIAGGPGWLDTDLYDVIASVPEGTTTATLKLMLQD